MVMQVRNCANCWVLSMGSPDMSNWGRCSLSKVRGGNAILAGCVPWGARTAPFLWHQGGWIAGGSALGQSWANGMSHLSPPCSQVL